MTTATHERPSNCAMHRGQVSPKVHTGGEVYLFFVPLPLPRL